MYFSILLFLYIHSNLPINNDILLLNQKGDSYWSMRGEIKNIKKSIEFYNDVISIDPNNMDVLIKLSNAYYWLGELMKNTNNYSKDYILNTFKDGINVSEKIINIDSNLCEGHFWEITNLLSWHEINGISLKILNSYSNVKKEIEKLMKKCANYNYGGVYRLWGRTIYKTPSIFFIFVEETKSDSEKYLETAIEIAPNFLKNKLYLAEDYLKSGKRMLAKELLDDILQTSIYVLPEALPENTYYKEMSLKIYEKEFSGD